MPEMDDRRQATRRLVQYVFSKLRVETNFGHKTVNMQTQAGVGPVEGVENKYQVTRLCAGPQYARRDVPVALAPSVSAHSLCLRSRYGTAAAILRASRALFRRTRGSPTNNWTAYRCPCRWPTATRPDLRLPRAPRLRFAFPGSVVRDW